MENKYSYVDSSHVEHTIDIKDEDLNLVHDKQQLHDVDLKGKTTTYFKDILHRFLKNKVSVVGFIIIAIIVLGAAIIDLSMPEFKISGTNSTEIFMPAKLFPTGTGWWDGTVQRDDYVYDTENQVIIDTKTGSAVRESAILENTKVFKENVPITTASVYATNPGYIAVRSSETLYADVRTPAATMDFSRYDYVLTYSLLNSIDGWDGEGYTAASSYDIYVSYTDSDGNIVTEFVEDNYTTFGENLTLNVEQILINKDASYAGKVLNSARVGFRVEAGAKSAIYLKEAEFTTEDTAFHGFGFTSANDMLLRDTGRWGYAGNTDTGLYGATITTCSFRYDMYDEVYGTDSSTKDGTTLYNYYQSGAIKLYYDEAKTQEIVPASSDDLVSKCVDYNGLPIYITILDEKAVPFIVDDEHPFTVHISKAGRFTAMTVDVVVAKYKDLGYSSMPIHIFGTDQHGYDFLRVVANGTLYSLGMAIVIFAFCFTFGLCWGAISGYFGGAVDIIMERIVDIISGVPSMVLLTLFMVIAGTKWYVFVFAMCFSGWIGTSGITRTQFYRFKRREYILASRSLGAGDGRLIFRHILPNGMGTIITSTVLMIPSIIYSEAGLAYLGLGFTDITSLGRILSDNQNYLLTTPILILYPSLIIALLMISFELFGQGLREAFNPSMKGAE